MDDISKIEVGGTVVARMTVTEVNRTPCEFPVRASCNATRGHWVRANDIVSYTPPQKPLELGDPVIIDDVRNCRGVFIARNGDKLVVRHNFSHGVEYLAWNPDRVSHASKKAEAVNDDIKTLRSTIATYLPKDSADAQQALAALERVEKALEIFKRSDREDAEIENASLRAKFARAKEALEKIDRFDVNAYASMVSQVFRLKNMARSVLASLTDDAPVQPPQISDAMIRCALASYSWKNPTDSPTTRMRAAIAAALEVMRDRL